MRDMNRGEALPRRLTGVLRMPLAVVVNVLPKLLVESSDESISLLSRERDLPCFLQVGESEPAAELLLDLWEFFHHSISTEAKSKSKS